MKVFIIALIFVVAVAAEVKKCGFSDGCGRNECCAYTGGTTNRFICKPLSKQNALCERFEDISGGYYFLHCPCERGLECKAEKVIIDREYGREYRMNQSCVDPNEKTT